MTAQFSSIDRISVKDSTLVHRILFDGKKAIGVEIEKNGTKENIYSNEVILSGGAINSPQLLMLSGIGNADHLKSLDIPVVAHVPGVGENLQDHLELGVAQKCKKPITLLKEQKFPKMIQIGKYCLYISSSCFLIAFSGPTHLHQHCHFSDLTHLFDDIIYGWSLIG